MLTLLSVTTHTTTSSAPKAHPPINRRDGHHDEWKMLNLLRWTRFYRLEDSTSEHICFKGRKMWLLMVGICDAPPPTFSHSDRLFPTNQVAAGSITAREAKYWSQRESRVGYPHQRTTHTYLQHDASAGLPAPDESLPSHRSSSSEPV
jgi:hypothetical protein